MFTVEASVDIDAPPDRVWAVLLDLPRYREWNTLLVHLEGEPVLGQRITLRLAPPAGRTYTFRPVVTSHRPPERFAWKAVTGVPGIIDGEHVFELSALPDGRTRLRNREVYSGLLSALMRRLPAMRDAQPGFERMNAELKQRTEQRS